MGERCSWMKSAKSACACKIDLLRVLEDRVFYRVGGTQPMEADFRVIAATNRDLASAIHRGAFREDLFLPAERDLPHTCPCLRERKEDIPILAEHFLRRFSQEINKHVDRISRAASGRM